MRAFSYCVVTSGHVTKKSVTSFDPPYPKKTHVERKLHECMFYKTGVILLIEVLRCQNRDFRPFCSSSVTSPDPDPITFIYELDPYSLKIHLMCKYVFLRQGFRELSDRHWQTDRQTRPNVYITPPRGWLNTDAGAVSINHTDADRLPVPIKSTLQSNIKPKLRPTYNRDVQVCRESTTVSNVYCIRTVNESFTYHNENSCWVICTYFAW